METLTCSCSKCHAVIGKFENLWDKIGKTYYSPICGNAQGLGGLAVVGDVRAAPKAGAIENSFLQDVACQVCGEKLGLRCDSAPEGHVLIKDQLILRVAGMTIVSDDTNRRASLRVRRKFSLIPQHPVSGDIRELRERSASLISSHHEVGNGVYVSGTTICQPSSDNDPLPGLLRFAEWAKDAIAGQRKDIDRVCSTVSRMEEDMNSFRDYMSDLCKELATAPEGKPWEKMKNDFDFLRDEVGQLRVDMECLPGSTGISSEDSVGLSGEELEALTNSIMKINQKVNEVENLKLDLQLLKGRLKRFEDAGRDFRQSVEPHTVEHTPARSSSLFPMMPPQRKVSAGNPEEDARQAQSKGQIPRKRKSDEFGDNSGSLKRSLSVPVHKKRGVSTELTPSTRRHSTARKPSGLSKVQLIDDTPSPVNTSKFMDGNNSEGDSHTPWRPEREYDSAPDTRTIRRRTLPTRGNLYRDVNSPDDIFTPPPETCRPAATTPPPPTSHPAAKPNTSPTTPRSRRRAYSEGLRNADGVRLTKNGTPDRRSGNYKYLKQYYDRLKAEKGQEDREEQGDTTDGGGNEKESEVLQSIESDGPRLEKEGVGAEVVVLDKREAKRAELEARDRLVRETLEREMEG